MFDQAANFRKPSGQHHDSSVWVVIFGRLPLGRLRYSEPDATENAIGYALHLSRLRAAVIRVNDTAGNVTETHEHKGDFKEW